MTTKRLYFVERREQGAEWVFGCDQWELKVDPALISGSGKRLAQVPVVLTRKMLHAGLNRGMPTREQAALLGAPWPPEEGWLSALIGKAVPWETYRDFLSLKRKPRPRRKTHTKQEQPT